MKGILTRLCKEFHSESGQSTVLATVSMLGILSFAGLAVDVGQLRYDRRQLQAAADAAALAGALEISACSGTTNCNAMQTAASQAVAENGLSGVTLVTQCGSTTATGATLTLNNGPCSSASDPNYNNAQYVEAVVRAPENTYFARIFRIAPVTVSARSEATMGSSAGQFCFFTSTSKTDQSTSGPVGILFNGGTVTSACGIMDDSGSANALESNNGKITAPYFDVHGGWSPDNGGTFSSTPVTGAAAVQDPLSSMTPPTPGSCTSYSSTPNNGATFSPGTYCGGFNLNSNVALNLNPGTYIIEGAVNVGSGASITGNGVTLYFTNGGSLTMNSGSTANLVAPTTGSMAGMLLWQNPSDTNSMIIDGGANAKYQGMIYLPGAQLTLNSQGNTAAYTILDVHSMIVDSQANFTLNNDYSSLPNGDPIKGGTAVLAE